MSPHVRLEGWNLLGWAWTSLVFNQLVSLPVVKPVSCRSRADAAPLGPAVVVWEMLKKRQSHGEEAVWAWEGMEENYMLGVMDLASLRGCGQNDQFQSLYQEFGTKVTWGEWALSSSSSCCLPVEACMWWQAPRWVLRPRKMLLLLLV